MLVKVTEEDIKLGVVADPARCPVARAVNRALDERPTLTKLFSKTSTATVGHFTVVYHGFKDRFIEDIQMPKEATDFIRDFDQSQPVEPIEFEL